MSKPVALIQCGDFWDNQRRVLPLAQALAARGWHAVVLPYSPWQGALFLRNGIDFRPLFARGINARQFPIAPPATVDSREILAIERWRTPRYLDRPWKALFYLLYLNSRAHAVNAVLADADPAHVFIWNGFTGVVAHTLRQLCGRRGIAHTFMERGLKPESLFVDPLGVNGYSSLHRQAGPESEYRRQPPEPHVSGVADGDRQSWRQQFGLTAKRVCFVPLQVQRDTNILLHSDHIKTMREFVLLISRALAGQDAVAVIRRHPEEIESHLNLPERANLRYIDEGEVDSWVDFSDLTVTLNSTVGLTAVLRSRALVALGRAIYTDKGLCTQATPENLAGQLARVETYAPPARQLVLAFRARLINHHTVWAGHCPESLGREPPAAPRVSKIHNPYQIPPDQFALLWREVLAHAQAAIGKHQQIGVWYQLRRRDRLALTYRKDRIPAAPRLIPGLLSASLGYAASRFAAVSAAETAETPHIAVCAQQHRPRCNESTLLVLDPYGQPHIGWLRRRGKA